MFVKGVVRLFSTQSVHKSMELLRKAQIAQDNLTLLQQKFKTLQQQVSQKQKYTNIRNKQITQLREQLKHDINKGDQLRSQAKEKSSAHRKEAIQNFAHGLIKLTPSFQAIKTFENESHAENFLELKEGYDLTSRLFFSTLEKYKITKLSVEIGTLYNAKTMEIVEEKETMEKQKIGKVAQVKENGWQAEGKLVHKAHVVIYK